MVFVGRRGRGGGKGKETYTTFLRFELTLKYNLHKLSYQTCPQIQAAILIKTTEPTKFELEGNQQSSLSPNIKVASNTAFPQIYRNYLCVCGCVCMCVCVCVGKGFLNLE